MEENLKVLEHLINDLKKRRENPYAVVNENYVGWDGVFLELNYVINSLENLIKRYKELEEKVNKYEKQIDLEWVEENYIEKSKVREKIEKYSKLQEEMTNKNHQANNINDCYKYGDNAQKAYYKKEALQELLEERN